MLGWERTGCSPTPGTDRAVETAAADARADEAWTAFGALQPPDGVKSAHDAMAKSFSELTTAVAAAQTRTPTAKEIENIVSIRNDAQTAEAGWLDAFNDEYQSGVWTMEGSSMLPAYRNGDLFAIPVLGNHLIERFQTVVFKFPLDPSRYFIKRVIALPGETVEVKGGSIFIDGASLEDKYEQSPPNYTYGPKTVPVGEYWVLGDNVNDSYDSHAWQQQCSAQQMCDFVPKSLILGVLPADATPVARVSC